MEKDLEYLRELQNRLESNMPRLTEEEIQDLLNQGFSKEEVAPFMAGFLPKEETKEKVKSLENPREVWVIHKKAE